MSEMELRIGVATPINGLNGLNFQQQIATLERLGVQFEEVIEEEEYYYSKEVALIDGTWYRLKDQKVDPDSCAEGTMNFDGSINYTCHWYNGGACFEEILQMAIEDAHTKEKQQS